MKRKLNRGNLRGAHQSSADVEELVRYFARRGRSAGAQRRRLSATALARQWRAALYMRR